MFREIINVKEEREIRYGTTGIDYHKSYGEIMTLLGKHGCKQIATMQTEHSAKIGFVYQDKPYVITIPQVFVKGKYNEKIGIRIVKYHLEILLDWSKNRVIDFDFLMLGNRVINQHGRNITVKDAVDTLPQGNINLLTTPEKTARIIDTEVIQDNREG